MPEISQICPAGADDSEGTTLPDLGDWEESEAPTFPSQKNFVDYAYDPRTGKILRTAGGWGAFGEDPDTAMKIYESDDCGRTWNEIADMNTITWPHEFYGFGFSSDPGVPIQMIAGANEGEWLLFDWWGGYYFTDDNWATHENRQYAGVDGGYEMMGGNAYYLGLIGTLFWNNTRHVPVVHNLDVPQIGFVYVIPFLPPATTLFVVEYIGIRRGIGPNGEDGWEDSLAPGPISGGGAGWEAVETFPAFEGKNGIWVVCVDYLATQTDNSGQVAPMRINTDPNLDPDSWSAPFYPVSESVFEDVYQGTKTGGSYGVGRVEFYPNPHGKLVFCPITGHPVGGRWFLFGSQDMIFKSEDNCVTWDNTLCDHTDIEANMHPILNWRASHSLGSFGSSRPHITDILCDPFGTGRLIAIGVTWNQPGITNRLAVFSCSLDGGLTWSAVGQIPLKRTAAEGGSPDSEGEDSPALARYIFPCYTP